MNAIHGIALFGLNGSGKSTLAHALALQTGYYEMDVEDYYFPTQRASRKNALEGVLASDSEDLPFSHSESKEAVERAIFADIAAHPQFILSGVTLRWSEDVTHRIDIAFYLRPPLELRLKRIEQRETRRFGARVLEGGDMEAQQREFREIVALRRESDVLASAEGLRCPIVRLDGTKPVEELVRNVCAWI